MGRLDGKVVIVTGGAGGIGSGTCRLLAREGAAVVVADLPAAKPGALADELVAAGHRALGVEVSIPEEPQVAAMVAAAVDAFGRLDGLHANAAATYLTRTDTSVLDLPVAELEEAFAVNVVGTLLCCRYAIPAMLAGGGGSIVATSSAASTHADLDKTAYGITKAGVNQLMRAVATQYGKRGIRANTILPGLIFHGGFSRMGEEPKRIVRANVLTPDFGDPESIGSLVAYLLGDEARYLTGQEIRVDGGMYAHSVNFAWSQPEISGR